MTKLTPSQEVGVTSGGYARNFSRNLYFFIFFSRGTLQVIRTICRIEYRKQSSKAILAKIHEEISGAIPTGIPEETFWGIRGRFWREMPEEISETIPGISRKYHHLLSHFFTLTHYFLPYRLSCPLSQLSILPTLCPSLYPNLYPIPLHYHLPCGYRNPLLYPLP